MHPHHPIILKENKTKMNKNNKSGGSGRGVTHRRVNHSFLNCRDAVLVGSAGGSPGSVPLTIASNGSGSASGSFPLAPIGLTAVRVVSGVPTIGGSGNVVGPLLRGLYNRAIDFQWYRVTRARLVFVGTVGSTMTGTLTLAAYSSAIDASINTSQALVSGPSTKVFNLAASTNKELSIPIPTDSSWRRVTNVLSTIGSASPFFGPADAIVPVATVDDVCFAGVSYLVAGASASLPMGLLYVDYDVEFRGPVDSSLNL